MADAPVGPFVGALLRLCWHRVRERIREALRDAGFDDLQDTHLLVFSYPLPDGVRPSELARQIGMSRQATNHVVMQMEALGYLERRAPSDGQRRLIFLAERGKRAGDAIFGCLRELESDWSRRVGPQRFSDFMDVLRELSGIDLERHTTAEHGRD